MRSFTIYNKIKCKGNNNMTEEIKNTVLEILNSTDEYKVDLGKEALSRLTKGLHEGGIEDKDIGNIIIAFTRLFVSADKHCSEKEYNFFVNVTGMKITYEQFYEYTNGGADEEFVASALKFVAVLNNEDRVALIIYGVALLSSDDTVSVAEQELIDKILDA